MLIPISQLVARFYLNTMTQHDLNFSAHGFIDVTIPTIVTNIKVNLNHHY